MKNVLLVAHAPSPNTQHMAEAVMAGLQHPDLEDIQAKWLKPLEAESDDVINCDGIILGTTENLGYMSGALKDFFDRTYYPCLEVCQGKPLAFYIRAGQDGTGTLRAINSITTGLKWRQAIEPLTCRGSWQDSFLEQCEELGTTFGAGIEAGVF